MRHFRSRPLQTGLILLCALMLASCGINSIPTLDENAKAAWGEVENQYQRRADLVPNLVATVKGFAAQEQEVLIGVTEARARATQTKIDAGALSDPKQLQAFGAAQDGLSSALARLMVVVEKYPELKSNENFLALQSQLEGTENRIAIARRDYNDAVRAYNTEIRTFPGVIGAKIVYGATPLQPYRATTSGADTAPQVKF